jgi:acyl carrier protein phosphodiesterase
MFRFIKEGDLMEKMALRMPKVKTMEEHALELEQLYKRLIKRGK